MADEVRFCAHCDQKVEKLPEGKDWTTRTGDQGQYKHKVGAQDGVRNCGRQFLAEHETYTES
jgi:hypothetical protein